MCQSEYMEVCQMNQPKWGKKKEKKNAYYCMHLHHFRQEAKLLDIASLKLLDLRWGKGMLNK